MSAIKNFERSLVKLHDAEKSAHDAMILAMPRGREAQWEHGEHTRTGIILSYTLDRRIKVRTPTGAETWICATRITGVS